MGLIIPFKFYPALFVLYFVWQRQWRVVAGALAGSLIILLGSLLTVGWEGNLAYFEVVVSELEGGGIPAFNNESISGFLMHEFTQGDVFSWLEVETPLWVSGLRSGLVLLVVGVVVWAMWRTPSDTGDQTEIQDLNLSLVILVMLLISTITWYHYYMWLLFPLTILFDRLLLAPQVVVRRIAWLAVAYGLVVVEGIVVLRPVTAQSLQDVWFLRLLLSQSFFGAVLFLGLTLKMRLLANVEHAGGDGIKNGE